MNKDSIIENFNNKDTILVVSSYPEKGVTHSSKFCAVSSYTKNTITSIQEALKIKHSESKFAILSITLEKEEWYKENNNLIWRIFKRNNPLSYIKLLKGIGKFTKVKKVIVEFEFASFGDTKTTIFFPIFLLLLRLNGKQVTLVLHQILEDIDTLAGHMGWQKETFRTKIFNLFFKGFLYCLSWPSNDIVVLEETLKKRLTRITRMEKKISVIPHGVDTTVRSPLKKHARKILRIAKNEFVILYFGHLTWYKGVDFLVNTVLKHEKIFQDRKIRLIIAGGESRTQKNKRHYQQFVQDVYKKVGMSKRIVITGFLKEDDIPLYFSCADLVTLPYRTFMSSSGPLALALSFGKPFIISSEMSGYFHSSDFLESFSESGLTQNDLVFDLTEKSLINHIQASQNRYVLNKLSTFSRFLAQKRSFQNTAPLYLSLIDTTSKTKTQSLQIEVNKLLQFSPSFSRINN